MIEARGASGGGFSYGLEGSDGKLVAGDLRPPADGAGGWMEAREAESDEPPEAKSEIVRALATRLSDGSTLVVGDERHRSDAILRGVLSAFGWAVAATLALGTLGGLWLSAQFLGCIDSMRLTAQLGRRPETGAGGSRSPRSTTISPRSRAPSTACSTASRSFSSPTSRSAPTSPTTCASRLQACCAASKARATTTLRRNWSPPPSKRRFRKSKACWTPSTRCCASARSRLARAERPSARSIRRGGARSRRGVSARRQGRGQDAACAPRRAASDGGRQGTRRPGMIGKSARQRVAAHTARRRRRDQRETDSGGVSLTVADDGVGVAPDE